MLPKDENTHSKKLQECAEDVVSCFDRISEQSKGNLPAKLSRAIQLLKQELTFEIGPCLSCGTDRQNVHRRVDNGTNGWIIECGSRESSGCNMQTGWHATEQEAIKCWNGSRTPAQNTSINLDKSIPTVIEVAVSDLLNQHYLLMSGMCAEWKPETKLKHIGMWLKALEDVFDDYNCQSVNHNQSQDTAPVDDKLTIEPSAIKLVPWPTGTENSVSTREPRTIPN